MSLLHIAAHGIAHAIAHPREPIRFISNPKAVKQSPVPWQVNIAVLALGIVTWCLGARLGIPNMDKAAIAMISASLSSLYSISWALKNTKTDDKPEA